MEKKVKLNVQLIMSLDSVLNRSWARLKDSIDIPRSTLYRIKDGAEGIDMKQLLAIANGLHIPVSKFFYTGSIRMIQRSEDYVTEPYLPCRYEYETLRTIVEQRRDITWVKAYDIIGITQDNLKNSLLSYDVPVTRFIDFCDGFGIDPFTILIDPNPKPSRRRKDDGALTPTDLAGLREDIRSLTEKTKELAGKYSVIEDRYNILVEKYENLLGVYDELLRRLGGHNSSIDMAADPLSDQTP